MLWRVAGEWKQDLETGGSSMNMKRDCVGGKKEGVRKDPGGRKWTMYQKKNEMQKSHVDCWKHFHQTPTITINIIVLLFNNFLCSIDHFVSVCECVLLTALEHTDGICMYRNLARFRCHKLRSVDIAYKLLSITHSQFPDYKNTVRWRWNWIIGERGERSGDEREHTATGKKSKSKKIKI